MSVNREVNAKSAPPKRQRGQVRDFRRDCSDGTVRVSPRCLQLHSYTRRRTPGAAGVGGALRSSLPSQREKNKENDRAATSWRDQSVCYSLRRLALLTCSVASSTPGRCGNIKHIAADQEKVKALLWHLCGGRTRSN